MTNNKLDASLNAVDTTSGQDYILMNGRLGRMENQIRGHLAIRLDDLTHRITTLLAVSTDHINQKHYTTKGRYILTSS